MNIKDVFTKTIYLLTVFLSYALNLSAAKTAQIINSQDAARHSALNRAANKSRKKLSPAQKRANNLWNNLLKRVQQDAARHSALNRASNKSRKKLSPAQKRANNLWNNLLKRVQNAGTTKEKIAILTNYQATTNARLKRQSKLRRKNANSTRARQHLQISKIMRKNIHTLLFDLKEQLMDELWRESLPNEGFNNEPFELMQYARHINQNSQVRPTAGAAHAAAQQESMPLPFRSFTEGDRGVARARAANTLLPEQIKALTILLNAIKEDTVSFNNDDERDTLLSNTEDNTDGGNLSIRSSPLATSGDPCGSYTIGDKTFQRQNVSGQQMRCFYNAVGLHIYNQMDNLINFANDPVVRAMIGKESNKEPTLQHFKNFIEQYPLAGQMTNYDPDRLAEFVIPKVYGLVSALAYINKIGIKIYSPESGKLNLMYQYIPKGATEVTYVYHSGLHFQALVPESHNKRST